MVWAIFDSRTDIKPRGHYHVSPQVHMALGAKINYHAVSPMLQSWEVSNDRDMRHSLGLTQHLRIGWTSQSGCSIVTDGEVPMRPKRRRGSMSAE